MTVGTFKGRITPLNLTEILKFLKESGKSGLLKAENEGAWRSLYVRRGRVIAGESSLPDESLIALLEVSGKIAAEQASLAAALVKGGVRAGRALVEQGSLKPAELWDCTENRVRALVKGMLGWPSGAFAFEEGALPPVDWMLVDLDILDAILAALREMGEGSILESRLPEPEAVFEHFTYSEGGEAPPLLAHERYVLALVNGRRSVNEIAKMSELGDAATKKILCMMFLVGCVRHRRDETVEGAPLPSDGTQKDVKAVIKAYNEMFAFIYSYMMKEVGPIAEHVLDKYLREVREANESLLSKIALTKEGTLNEDALVRNLQRVHGNNRLDALVKGLNEFLYSGQLAVKRTLGADHEAVVIRRLNEIRKTPASLS